ncbi:type II secretion system F family protein [bacterium]|nr:type II secretion system F family protein [bacterium]
MPTYTYVVRDSAGKRIEDSLKAVNYEAALESLRKKGAGQIVTVREVRSGVALDEMTVGERISVTFYRLRHRVPLKTLVFFTRQLSTMFSAGLTIEKSIQNLLAEEKSQRFKKILAQVSTDLKKGYALSEAMAKHPGVFSNLYIALVHAGEVSGNLHVILEELSSYLETVADTRQKVISALSYPVFSLVFLAGVITFLLLVVVPRFSEVYTRFNARLPGPTRMLIALSHTISNHFVIVAFLVVATLVLLWIVTLTPRGGYIWDKIKLNFPVFGGLMLNSLMDKFSRTFGILIGSGVPVLESLGHAIRVVENRVIGRGLREARSLIKDGYAISVSLKKTRVFPAILVQLIATGEETGDMDKLLDKAAQFYEKQVDATISRLTSLIEPLLIIMIGVVIALILISVYLPVFMLGRAVQMGA